MEEFIKDLIKNEKEILNRGYVTHMLTGENGKIYGIIDDCYINDWSIEGKLFSWSEVYVEPPYTATIIRSGYLLIDANNKELSALHRQSKINFGFKPKLR